MSQSGVPMNLVTNLGDIAVLLPASLGLVVLLARLGLRRDAAAYAAAVAACLTTALLAKLAFAACGENRYVFGVESPSGHAAFAATFYGSLAALLAAGRPIASRTAIYGGALALVLLIAASRIALGAHTPPEVAIGLIIGLLSVAAYKALSSQSERLEMTPGTIAHLSPLAVLFAVCWLALAGRWVAEPYIDTIASLFGAQLHVCR